MYTGIKVPFPEFKWRWATFAPTENLNDPRVYFGVLRALYASNGEAPSSVSLLESLQEISFELSEHIEKMPTLARNTERNLLRNSQQYWSGLGLLDRTQPVIKLTDFGMEVAEGRITAAEFAAQTILNLTLPNSKLEDISVLKKWQEYGLEFKPLSLILSVIAELWKRNPAQAYLTSEEVFKAIIPLSSLKIATSAQYADHILAFREDPTSLNSYENFIPGSNDHRMAREFLLFLSYHGYLQAGPEVRPRSHQIFSATSAHMQLISDLLQISHVETTTNSLEQSIASYDVVIETIRARRQIEVLARPGQQKFRKDILKISGGKCLLSEETFSIVLTACHIIPVEKNGSDLPENGLCLREDLHILFDSGHIRIAPDGKIHVSNVVRNSKTYKNLPEQIILPSYINISLLKHRWRYYS